MYVIPESLPKKMATKPQQLLHVSCTLHIICSDSGHRQCIVHAKFCIFR